MKKTNLAILSLASLMAMGALTGCVDNGIKGKYAATIWCPEAAVKLTTKQIKAFNEANPDWSISAKVQAVGEGDAATQMISDVEGGADLFFFAQDQFARLLQAQAIGKVPESFANKVKEANDASSVKAVTAASTSGSDLYAYPLTSDNGYFMYYDKTVVQESSLGDLTKIIADCNAAGKNFSMEVESSGWYLASWFFAVEEGKTESLCVSEWTMNEAGKFTSVNDTFNSANGLIATKGMYELQSYSGHVSSSTVADFSKGSAVVVSGTWDYKAATDILGDNLGAAPLPSFKVGEKKYHMGSFSGNKLLGVKPQEDAYKSAALNMLADYLTDEDRQLERFNELAWGPSNKEAQKDEAVKANPALAALQSQSAYAKPQGQIHGSWWDISKAIGEGVKASGGDEAKMQAALSAYQTSIEELFKMGPEELNAFTIIGKLCGSEWNVDFPMTAPATFTEATNYDPAGVWTSDVLALEAGDEFKVRQGKSWDVNFGVNGAAGGDNIVVAEAGNYIVKLTISHNGDALAAAIEVNKQ